MLYADIDQLRNARPASNYILRFVSHFDQYVNSRLVRSVGYDQIVWC
jgi:hypothetical protein